MSKLTNEKYKTLLRDDDKLFNLIDNEIKKKYNFKRIWKDIKDEIFEIHNKEGNIEYEDNFKHNQCLY